MFLFLSKLIPPFVFPPGGNLVGFVLAWFLGRRRPRLAGVLFLVSFVTLYALSTGFGSTMLLAPLENWYPDVNVAGAPQADAIVVLGGGVQGAAGRHTEAELSEAGDRVRKGAALFHAGKAPLIVLSGGNIEFLIGSGEAESAGTARMLESFGVPGDKILIEDRSQNTHENAEFTWKLLSACGVRHILLVTSAAHMPRSAGLFRHEGFTVSAMPCNHTTGWGTPSLLFRLAPDPQLLANSRNALKEYVGLAVYKMRGWL